MRNSGLSMQQRTREEPTGVRQQVEKCGSVGGLWNRTAAGGGLWNPCACAEMMDNIQQTYVMRRSGCHQLLCVRQVESVYWNCPACGIITSGQVVWSTTRWQVRQSIHARAGVFQESESAAWERCPKQNGIFFRPRRRERSRSAQNEETP